MGKASGRGRGCNKAVPRAQEVVEDPYYPAAASNRASPLSNMTPLQLAEVAGSEASQRRSRQRCVVPTPQAWHYLNQLSEGKNFWFALRKHAPYEVCIQILQELAQHSRWAERRKTDNEELRSLYHEHCRNIKYFDPTWTDRLMAERVAAADAASPQEESLEV
eukprot:s597_g5.t1